MAYEDRSDRIAHDGPDLLWLQVALDIEADIKSGALPPKSKLPSADAMAELYGVARVTVRRAFEHLRSEGLLTVVRGRGTFVAPER